VDRWLAAERLSSGYRSPKPGQILTHAVGIVGHPIDSLYLQLYIRSMRSEVRLAAHSEIAGARTDEVWYGGQMIGCVYGRMGRNTRDQ
jgi:hypothetical protein